VFRRSSKSMPGWSQWWAAISEEILDCEFKSCLAGRPVFFIGSFQDTHRTVSSNSMSSFPPRRYRTNLIRLGGCLGPR
jgi:hypothetical protein